MKKLLILPALFLSLFSSSCSDDDGKTPADEYANVPIITKTVTATGFYYKEFFQENASTQTRKGIVILAHGDGTDENDGLLNDQCTALAQNGYVAITTSYVSLNGANLSEINQQFQQNIEQVILHSTTDYEIPRNKVIIGGASRGGNNAFALVLPGQMGINPTAGIKGVILECSGGDTWKGSAVLYPTAYMSNLNDDVMGSNANDFKNGLQNNNNPGVKTTSECLIIGGTGHCGDASKYKAFIVKKVKEWLP